ncbi:MAG: MarR family winged helix-turn-helix transcriptional regulator [Eubacterium sp.]
MKHKEHCKPLPPDVIGPRIMFLSKLIRREFNKAAAQQGLFSGQQDIVREIVYNQGITIGELANRLGVSSATASVSVKRMEKAGFIIKKEDERDTRIIRLYPTEKAKEAPEKIQNHMDDLEKRLTDNMTEPEVQELYRLLDIAVKNISERGDSDA